MVNLQGSTGDITRSLPCTDATNPGISSISTFPALSSATEPFPAESLMFTPVKKLTSTPIGPRIQVLSSSPVSDFKDDTLVGSGNDEESVDASEYTIPPNKLINFSFDGSVNFDTPALSEKPIKDVVNA